MASTPMETGMRGLGARVPGVGLTYACIARGWSPASGLVGLESRDRWSVES